MRRLHHVRLSLTVEGPILTQSSTPGAYGVDGVAARNAQGQFYLPGSLIKGRVREALHDLGRAGDATKWLGSEGKTDDARGRLVFRDLVLRPGADVVDGTLHRIAIDEQAGAVKRGALVVIESPFAPGASYVFEGDIELIADTAEADSARAVVAKALAFVTSVGGLRGIGFGVVQSFSLGDPVQTPDTFFSAKRGGGDRLEIRIRPVFPFCLARAHPDGNLFSSIDEIPGGVIKGALANVLSVATGLTVTELGAEPRWAALATAFDSLAFSHALPTVGRGLRPCRMPHSLVRVHGRTVDVALLGDAFVARSTAETEIQADPDGKADLGKWRAPAFLWDWKGPEKAAAQEDFEKRHPNRPQVPRELRVRTAIDANYRRAKEDSLFAYETVVPDGFEWVGFITLPAEADGRLHEQLETAFEIAGLWGFGKTKSRARVDLLPGDPGKSTVQPRTTIVTLQTDALLFSIADLAEADTTDSTLRSKYEEYFKGLDPGLVLVRYFASQRLVGGENLKERFMKNQPTYHPWMLTDAGSVFVLDVGSTTAAEVLSECGRRGLPALAREQPKWGECPYLRENGYGEIRISAEAALPFPTDLESQTVLSPRGDQR